MKVADASDDQDVRSQARGMIATTRARNPIAPPSTMAVTIRKTISKWLTTQRVDQKTPVS